MRSLKKQSRNSKYHLAGASLPGFFFEYMVHNLINHIVYAAEIPFNVYIRNVMAGFMGKTKCDVVHADVAFITGDCGKRMPSGIVSKIRKIQFFS